MPDALRFAVWFTAWCRGAVSLDDARDAVVGGDAAHDVAGLPGREGTAPVIVALGLLRTEGATTAGVALPVPGDPLGCGGPPAFNAEALEAGEAVVLPDAGLGLVPQRVGAGVVWQCLPASGRRQVPDLAEADTGLRAALPRAADALAALEVARWRPEVVAELTATGTSEPDDLPPGADPRAVRAITLGLRCRRIVELALLDDGGALTAADAEARRSALVPLDAAARRALVAAAEAPFGPAGMA